MYLFGVMVGAVAALVVLQGDGCMEQTKPSPHIETVPYQRFVPIERAPKNMGVPWNGHFALDTQTGAALPH